jgi:hypothetical protein
MRNLKREQGKISQKFSSKKNGRPDEKQTKTSERSLGNAWLRGAGNEQNQASVV